MFTQRAADLLTFMLKPPTPVCQFDMLSKGFISSAFSKLSLAMLLSAKSTDPNVTFSSDWCMISRNRMATVMLAALNRLRRVYWTGGHPGLILVWLLLGYLVSQWLLLLHSPSGSGLSVSELFFLEFQMLKKSLSNKCMSNPVKDLVGERTVRYLV